MKKYFVSFTLLLYCVGSIYAAHDLVFPSHWLLGESHAHVIEKGTLQFFAPYTGNVSIPPYVYEYLEGDHNVHKITVVSSICGSSHDGTWVQAPKKDGVRRAGWYYDGPFLNADIDTLRLPHTIGSLGDGAFENGKIRVLIVGAPVPPEFKANFNYNAFQAKLIVPTGSIQAYSEHEAWSRFSQIEEGAETYFPAQMVQVDGAWYELYESEGKLICSEDADSKLIIPDDITFASQTCPVTTLGESSVYKYKIEKLTLGANIRSFDINCLPYITNSLDWYCDGKIALDSISVSESNPYMASAGGAVFTKDYKELIYLPRQKEGNVKFKMFTLPYETTYIRDNAFACWRNGERYLITVSIYMPNIGIEISNNNDATYIYFSYLEYKVPNILSEGQLPIRAADWAAYWMKDDTSFDLQYLPNNYSGKLVFPSELKYGPISGKVKTIGKYGQYGDETLRMAGFYQGASSSRYFFQLKDKTIKSATIPEGIEEIYGALMSCTNMENVSLPSSLRVLGYESFYRCTSLKTITIPSGVSVVGTDVFYGCKNLTDIYIESTTPPAIYNVGYEASSAEHTFSHVFNGISANPTLHVPAGCKHLYMSSPVWNGFTNIEEDAQTGIVDVRTDVKTVPTTIWTIDGQKGQRRGLNIVRYNDGNVRKVITK